MNTTAEHPTRKGLLVGAAMVALHGLRQEYILAARHAKHEDFMRHPNVVRCTKAMEELRTGGAITDDDERIRDLMAHTCQVLRVSIDEWESVVRLPAAA